jgi:hypothetical protein
MNNELKRIWKDVVVTYLKYYPGICLVGLRKTTKTLCGNSRTPD